MIARRRAARPTPPETKLPWLSGPRCTSVSLIDSSTSGSTGAPSRLIRPQIPHMDPSLVSPAATASRRVSDEIRDQRGLALERPLPCELEAAGDEQVAQVCVRREQLNRVHERVAVVGCDEQCRAAVVDGGPNPADVGRANRYRERKRLRDHAWHALRQ